MEVTSIIDFLSNSQFKVFFNFNSKVMKMIKNKILETSTSIFRKCTISGTFPEILVVTPFHIKGAKIFLKSSTSSDF